MSPPRASAAEMALQNVSYCMHASISGGEQQDRISGSGELMYRPELQALLVGSWAMSLDDYAGICGLYIGTLLTGASVGDAFGGRTGIVAIIRGEGMQRYS